ncbi:MAG TPA: helix-turn-helix domain-containing protein [Pyrinomonadaceae bacterium]
MDRRIQVVVSQLQSRISSPLKLTELARQVNLSSSRLRHLFKNEIGQTPAQYLKQLRMQRAEVLLRTTFLSIKEIVNKVGFMNTSSFVREFRRIYKLSPTAYRRSVTHESRRH